MIRLYISYLPNFAYDAANLYADLVSWLRNFSNFTAFTRHKIALFGVFRSKKRSASLCRMSDYEC